MRKTWVASLVFLLCLSLTTGSNYASAEPPASLELTIPDYIVTTTGNVDFVEIPDGMMLTKEEGRPEVPYYATSIDYPKGYRVQDVALKERAGLVTATGLRLPIVILNDTPTQPIKMKEGWYPEESYSWRLWENADGSTTLAIQLYPFYYNPETTEVKFYKNYSFSIEYTISNIAITALFLDKDIYSPGDKVSLDISLNNPGEMQNVVVSVLIKQYGSDVTIIGLPLKSLKGLAGDASLTEEWDSLGIEEGYYYAEVTLSDTSGNILDKKTADISIGISETISPSAPETTSPTQETTLPTQTEFPTLYVIIGVAVVVVAVIITLLIFIRYRKKA
jgi:hypothetical protein